MESSATGGDVVSAHIADFAVIDDLCPAIRGRNNGYLRILSESGVYSGSAGAGSVVETHAVPCNITSFPGGKSASGRSGCSADITGLGSHDVGRCIRRGDRYQCGCFLRGMVGCWVGGRVITGAGGICTSAGSSSAKFQTDGDTHRGAYQDDDSREKADAALSLLFPLPTYIVACVHDVTVYAYRCIADRAYRLLVDICEPQFLQIIFNPSVRNRCVFPL